MALSDQSDSRRQTMIGFLRYIADPSRNFDLDLFHEYLRAANARGYVSVQAKGQVMLTPLGRRRAFDEDQR